MQNGRERKKMKEEAKGKKNDRNYFDLTSK